MNDDMVEVDKSDLEKIHDALSAARGYFIFRDQMNRGVHLAKETTWSPITNLLCGEYRRLTLILMRVVRPLKETA